MARSSLCAVFIKTKVNNGNNNNKRIMTIRILEFHQEIKKKKKNLEFLILKFFSRAIVYNSGRLAHQNFKHFPSRCCMDSKFESKNYFP